MSSKPINEEKPSEKRLRKEEEEKMRESRMVRNYRVRWPVGKSECMCERYSVSVD